jgi:DNA polymerase-3 subunit alpha
MKYPGSLHNHSQYSNLRLRDSINREEEMIDYAIELGHDVIAITEHDTIANAVKVEKYYKKIKETHPNFKVILGNEIYLCRDGLTKETFVKGADDYFHFLLLAADAEGHKQIRELSTRAWKRSYKTGKMRRVPTYYQDIIEIIGNNKGHVIASTACLGGFLGTKLLEWREKKDKEFYGKIINWLKNIENIFGKGYFYLEMQPSSNEEQIFVNKEILKLSNLLDIPYIITTDSHYLKKEDAPIHEAFLNSQDGDREVASFYETTYLMSTEELENYLSYLSHSELYRAYENILKIKSMCSDFSLLKPLKIPSLIWRSPKATKEKVMLYYAKIPYLETFMNSEFIGDQVMARLIVDKLESDARLQEDRVYKEVNSNLEMTWISSEVNKAHWSAYFLNLQKTIDVCWEAGTLVGPGRGSGVGFLLLYLLDIIQINPLWETTQTFSWRFLNPSRVSVLDIDTDIEGGRRATVLQALKKFYGEERVANVATFGTEASKAAVQTAARGLGIDVDIALYIASLIPADRGKFRTLDQCYYGDEENEFEPIPLFVQAMKDYPDIWNVARRIEGLVCRLGEHAGGVIFVDEPFENSTALMRVPNGDLVTQFDLHDCEDCSLIKIDLLSVEALDKIHNCIDLLEEYGYIQKEATLRQTYEKLIGIYIIERESEDMWKMVWRHEIESLFQMEQASGIQGIALTKPKSVDDLAILNSVIRLMATEKGAEQPLAKYARFKNDIGQWYEEAQSYGLKFTDIEILKPIIGLSYGICESQEKFMSLVQTPECGGFDLGWADRLRKAIAKKNPKDYDKLTKEYFERVKEQNLNFNLCNYVWNVLVATSRGYGFNASHTLAYSLVALQEMNLAYRFPIVFWNCACLITDSGGAAATLEEEDDDEDDIEEVISPEEKKKKRSTDYKKLAAAIGKIQQAGIQVMPPDINTSSYTFTPDVENNRILFGLSGMLNVGEDVILDVIKNRPYTSLKDFYQRVKPKKQAMISLIKSGAFDNMEERKFAMTWYLWEVCDKKTRLTLQNMPSLIKYGLLPEDTEERVLARRFYEFNRYLKSMCKSYEPDSYLLDSRAISFLNEMEYDNLMYSNNIDWFIGIKAWDKVYQQWMDVFREWISVDKEQILDNLNDIIFLEEWNKYAQGNFSSWEMETLCFYYHDHELKHLNKERYGISDFHSLPEEPVIEKTYVKGGKTINLFHINRICGTCIAKDKNKGHVILLTPDGVVTVKLRKEMFSLFDKQISERGEDGVKHVKERSWFNRGSMIMVQGIRSKDNFIAKKYASSGGHTLYKVESIDQYGDIILRDQRYQGESEEDNEI